MGAGWLGVCGGRGYIMVIKVGDKVRGTGERYYYKGIVTEEEDTYRGRYLKVKGDDGLVISMPEYYFEKVRNKEIKPDYDLYKRYCNGEFSDRAILMEILKELKDIKKEMKK